MSYDVVVVGGGIGGLTVTALLSARGMNTCLLERQSQVGGCIARVEFGGYDFEPGMGLYTSFGPGGIYEKLFSKLPVEVPETSLLTSPYVTRQTDGSDVQSSNDDLYVIAGGPASLAERLAESIKRSGGSVRLNSPVLRLSYDESGRASGVDLLSGERVFAKKAIVSNLTVWDTYGKLVGLARTPPEIKKRLNALQGTGVYVVYASIEEPAVPRLPSERLLVQDSEGALTVAIATHQTAPLGKRAVTMTTRTDVEPWFSYQSSEEEYEEWDQEALEHFWKRLHAAVPELGGDIEIIETANPRTYYDLTRRKLGMVMGVESTEQAIATQTFLPNLFMVGDTVSPAARLDTVVESAMSLARLLS
ncbi:MAG TPA: FAD-dependent oxidoreductase [Pyrinomonadaceae bacterium]|nr:FAD-dependent oxidoreductase [Pyrinomonadaceae bacterium]